MEISILDVIDYGIDIGKGFGIFQRMKREMVKQPDVALKYLIQVIDAVKVTFDSFCKVLNDYLALWFNPAELSNNPNLMIEIKTRLRKMKGGSIGIELKEARFHCSQIHSIYEQWLSPYFGGLLKRLSGDYAEAQAEIEDLFNRLSISDMNLLAVINEMDSLMKEAAKEVLGNLQEGRYNEAMMRIRDDENKWGDKEEELSKVVEEMIELKTGLREVTGAII